MPIVVDHSSGLPLAAQFGASIGQASAIGQQQEADDQRTRFLLGMVQNQNQLQEQQRQFNVSTSLHAAEDAAQQYRYGQQLVQQQYAQQAQLASQEMARQEDYARRMMHEQALGARQLQQQQFQNAYRGALSQEQQLNQAVKDAQKMKLTPEGQRVLGDWIGKVRKLQAARDSINPAPYQQLMGKAMSEYADLGLQDYQQQQPTPDQMAYQSLWGAEGQKIVPGQPLAPGKYWRLKGMRNGVPTWEDFDVKDQTKTFADRAEGSWAPAPDGGVFYDDGKGGIKHVAPQKATPDAGAVKPLSPKDEAAINRAAVQAALAAYQVEHPDHDVPVDQYLEENIGKFRQRIMPQSGAPTSPSATAAQPFSLPTGLPGLSGYQGPLPDGSATGPSVTQPQQQSAPDEQPVEVKSPEDLAALPEGKLYLAPDGTIRRKTRKVQ